MDPAFQEIQQLCLKKAKEALEKDAVPDGDAARTARELMEVACSIEMINLQQAMQNRYGAAGRSARS